MSRKRASRVERFSVGDAGQGEISQLLEAIRSGDRTAESALVVKVYPELRRIASGLMGRERMDHVLQTTALVHEAYLRLGGQLGNWRNRAHFFAVASHVMRRVLVDYARQRQSLKRGGNVMPVELDEDLRADVSNPDELIYVDGVLDRLCGFDQRQGRIAEMKIFSGMTDQEIADVLTVSVRTVKQDWSMARAWLHGELSRNRAAGDDSGTVGPA